MGQLQFDLIILVVCAVCPQLQSSANLSLKLFPFTRSEQIAFSLPLNVVTRAELVVICRVSAEVAIIAPVHSISSHTIT